MNSNNYTYCCSEKLHTVHKVSLRDMKVWRLDAMSAHKIMGPMVFKKINSDRYILSILKLFFRE
jgi:hypothetical protein